MTVECHSHAMLRFVFVKQPAMMFHNDCALTSACPRRARSARPVLFINRRHQRRGASSRWAGPVRSPRRRCLLPACLRHHTQQITQSNQSLVSDLMQCAKLLSDRNSSEWEPSMGEVTTIGLDLAKHVFQVHGVDAEGATVLRKQLRRAQVLAFFSRLPPCLVGLEACATAHYWARELCALGHEARLMAAQYVKAYIKRNKHDAADAEAICEAIGRPTMRFVPVKTADQQAAVLLHRGRERLVRQRTG